MMTGALIGAGSGLVLGIALLIWGLRERGKRHAAERACDDVRQTLKEALSANERLRVEINVVRRNGEGCRTQLQVLRSAIARLYEKLAKCKDPEAVAQLLNDELGEQL